MLQLLLFRVRPHDLWGYLALRCLHPMNAQLRWVVNTLDYLTHFLKPSRWGETTAIVSIAVGASNCCALRGFNSSLVISLNAFFGLAEMYSVLYFETWK